MCEALRAMAEIVHIALVKLDEDHDDGLAIDHVIDHARRILPLVPGVDRLEVGRALPEVIPLTARAQGHHHAQVSDKKWDLVFTFRFASHAAHERFRGDADRLAFFDQFLLPQSSAVKAWSFEIAGDDA